VTVSVTVSVTRVTRVTGAERSKTARKSLIVTLIVTL